MQLESDEYRRAVSGMWCGGASRMYSALRTMHAKTLLSMVRGCVSLQADPGAAASVSAEDLW